MHVMLGSIGRDMALYGIGIGGWYVDVLFLSMYFMVLYVDF